MTLLAYWPQLVWLALAFMRIGVSVAAHGRSTTISAGAAIFNAVLGGWLLYMGGFWDVLSR